MTDNIDKKYKKFFKAATEHDPFPYQQRLGTADVFPELLSVATGLGKTAAVVMSWLFKLIQGRAPRRLVYCLPMRVLVQQTEEAVSKWIGNLASDFAEAGVAIPSVHVLMGGQADQSWDLSPEQPAVIIGTQDLLISRALNRGYAMSRYRWPIHFALLNNDCLWVFDELQLMGVGVETSAQLAAFRKSLGAVGPGHTLWMSATIGLQQLDTVDHPLPEGGLRAVDLDAEDMESLQVSERLNAPKPVQPLEGVRITKDSDAKELKAIAAQVLKVHRPGSRTLVVVNRVSRAQGIFEALGASGRTTDNTILIHSRFRPVERRQVEQRLFEDQDLIAVCTQAVEAGVDVSAKTLITELAPWPSMVQRFGRCNRYGEHDDAAVYWIDIEEGGSRGACALPYSSEELTEARNLLASVKVASPIQLREVQYQPPSVVRPVIRRRDILELFDTTADLSGNDIDVSRYVRDAEDVDVRFFWRIIDQSPDAKEPGPHRDETCAVSIGGAREFIDKLSKGGKDLAWRWDHLDHRWQRVRSGRSLLPGEQIMLSTEAGGYDPARGWTGEPKGIVPRVEEVVGEKQNGYSGDPETGIGRWIRLEDHLQHVHDEVMAVANALGLELSVCEALEKAATWHDIGKAHESFQQMLTESAADSPPPTEGTLWAKSSHSVGKNVKRPHFRHELGSALLYLQQHPNDADADLVSFLIACHHGKVRLSIRSMPQEKPPEDRYKPFARGWHQGDLIPVSGKITLLDGTVLEPTPVDLGPLRLGSGSWLDRMLGLRDEIGIFQLAFLEAVMRAGDGRASAAERQGDQR